MSDQNEELSVEDVLRSIVEDGYLSETKANRAREALARKVQEPAVKAGWIAIEDQMPPMEEEVLVYCPNFGDGRIELDSWGEIRECPVSFSTESVCVGEGWDNNEFEEVSHWMPKPCAPAKETSHVQA